MNHRARQPVFLSQPEPRRHFSILPFGEPIRVQPYSLVSLRDKRLSPGASALMKTLREIIREEAWASQHG